MTVGVSVSLGALSSGVMPLRAELLEMKRRVVRGYKSRGAVWTREGVAKTLGSAARATREVCKLRQATRASLEALERVMAGGRIGVRVGVLQLIIQRVDRDTPRSTGLETSTAVVYPKVVILAGKQR